jgi:hypothetical protein
VRTLPGTLGDPLRAVTNLPGVARSPRETGWLVVRGGDPRDTAVYVDGVRVPLVHHLGGFTSVVHPAFVDRVDFLPGGGGVRYGRATAGAVDLVTRGAGARPEARVGANLVFASAWGGASAGEVTLAGSVRRSYLDAVLSPFLPEESRGAIPRFWDWQARADLPGDASIFAFGFVDAVTVPGQDGAEAEIEVATQRLHGRASVPVGEKSLVLTPFLAWEHLLFEIADWNDRTARDHWGGGLRAELADEGSGPSGWSGGVDAELFSASLSSSGLRRDLPVAMPDLYVDGRLGEGTASHLVAGVRLDTLLVGDQPSRVGLSPRLSGTLQVAPRSAADLSVGVSHQPPPWEFVLGPPEGAVLELDEAVNVALGVRHGAGPVDGGAEGWFRLVNRRTALEADGSIGQGEGYAVGLDVHSTLRAGRLDALAKIGLASSQVREHADEEYRPSEYDQPLTVGVAAAYDLGRFWTAGARFRYASGFPVGAEGTVAVDFLTLQEVELAANSRVDDFHSLDLKISKRFLFRTWRLDAFLDVQNVYNRRVPEPAITGFANVSLSGMGYGLMTLPIFGVEGQFGGDPRRP